jgi:lipopolysaccharide biosynthesis glycosyltransferase
MNLNFSNSRGVLMYKKKILIALADKNFLNQAKQLFSSVYWNSGWQGDYCLLAYEVPKPEQEWFTQRGILVKDCDPFDVHSEKIGDKITACKIYLFDEFFKAYNYVVYLDVDIVTRGSIDGILYDLQRFSACHSLGQNLENNLIPEADIPNDIKDELRSKFDLKQKAFNSGVMAFPTSIIYDGIADDLLNTFNRYVKYGLFRGDQLPFNLFFYNKWDELPPAFNQITALNDDNYDKNKLRGLIIHCVCFGDGPWNEESIFYDEWQRNYHNADFIDLNNIPRVHISSDKEIKTRSKDVVKVYLMGGTLSAKIIIRRMISATKDLIINPKKIYRKFKQIYL